MQTYEIVQSENIVSPKFLVTLHFKGLITSAMLLNELLNICRSF